MNQKSNILPPAIVLLLLAMMIISAEVRAQKKDIYFGSFEPLAGQKSYNVVYTYDSLTVGNQEPETSYLERKRAEWNLRESDKGNAFVTKWYADRPKLYEPAFAQGFAKFSRINITDAKAKYTIILKTRVLEGGWNGGVIDLPGQVGGELWIVESADHNKIIAKIWFEKITGKVAASGDAQITKALQSAYDMAGQVLGIYLKKQTK